MAFEARLSRWRIALLFLIGIAFVLAGLFLIGVIGERWVGALGTPRSSKSQAQVVGWVVILFFGLCSLIAALRMFQSGVEIRIDLIGIWSRRWSDQTIPWAEIERITFEKVENQRFACLFLRDPDAFPSKTLQGKLAGVNKAMGYGDITLGTTRTDASFRGLAEAIQRFAPSGLVA